MEYTRLAQHKEGLMHAVVRNGKVLHINGCGYGGIFSQRNEYHSIPDQKIPDEWWDDEGKLIADLRWPNDLTQYTPEELVKTPAGARAALKARGPAINESMPGLAERVGLMERALGWNSADEGIEVDLGE